MQIKQSIAKILVRLGVSANLLTAAGLLMCLLSAWLVIEKSFFLAGGTLLLGGLCDLMDGAVARAAGKNSAFGGILDSSLDRYGDGAVLGAVIIYCAQIAQYLWAALALSALLGSFAISYVRARAECETDHCRVGFWERGERLVLISLALLLGNLGAALWILGVGAHWTVFQRLAFSYHQTEVLAPKQAPFYLRSSARDTFFYFFKATLLVALLLFWRPA